MKYEVSFYARDRKPEVFRDRDEMLKTLANAARSEVASVWVDGMKQEKVVVDALFELASHMFGR